MTNDERNRAIAEALEPELRQVPGDPALKAFDKPIISPGGLWQWDFVSDDEWGWKERDFHTDWDACGALIAAMKERWQFAVYQNNEPGQDMWDVSCLYRAEFSLRKDFGLTSGIAASDKIPEAVARATSRALGIEK